MPSAWGFLAPFVCRGGCGKSCKVRQVTSDIRLWTPSCPQQTFSPAKRRGERSQSFLFRLQVLPLVLACCRRYCLGQAQSRQVRKPSIATLSNARQTGQSADLQCICATCQPARIESAICRNGYESPSIRAMYSLSAGEEQAWASSSKGSD